jgi:hypothetical protein
MQLEWSSDSESGVMGKDLEATEQNQSVVQRILATYFTKLAILSSRHPIKVIIISVLICCSCSLGFVRFRLETNQEPQWTAINSIWTEYQKQYEAIYGPFYGYATVLAMVRADKASELNDMVVNKFVLKELLEVETQLRKITVNTTTDGKKSTEDLCLHPAGPEEPCMVTSIWWHWNYSLSKMESDPVILSTVARSGFSHPLGFTMPPSTFLGGYEVKYGRVVSARVIKTQFVFTTRLDYQDSLTQLYNAIEETVLAMNKTAVYSSFFVETSVSRSQTKVKPTKIHFTNTSSRHQ